MSKTVRVRLNTTLTPEVRKELELFRVQKGFSGINEAIEYLTTKYINGGFENENKRSEREDKQ